MAFSPFRRSGALHWCAFERVLPEDSAAPGHLPSPMLLYAGEVVFLQEKILKMKSTRPPGKIADV